ncbi:hypothetical protein [Sphingomonas sp.]|uniref:hypothetical protein n=1 Tax=Sphingomonas sp. TaxID=28214 RepID=UPI003D6CC6FF
MTCSAYPTLAAFKAAPISNLTQALQDPSIAFGAFYGETANAPYAADDINIIKANSTAISVGAWVRQAASSIQTNYGALNKVVASFNDILPVTPTSTQAIQNINVPNQQPTQSGPVVGSVGNGLAHWTYNRTGGYGSYGQILISGITSANVNRTTELDSAFTVWTAAQHLNSRGSGYLGAWIAANSPSSGKDYAGDPLGQTFTGGIPCGMEINCGNRWADFGLQLALGGEQYTVGLQVVPDVAASSDGPAPDDKWPGTFGIVLSHSNWGHRWWTGQFVRYDTIMPTGYAYYTQGGSTENIQPASAHRMDGHFVTGLDFVAAKFTDAVFRFGFSQIEGYAWDGGGQALPGHVKGYLKIDVGGTRQLIPYFDYPTPS